MPRIICIISGVIIFVRQGLSFSELSTSSLSSLDPYSDYVGVSISLNNSSSLSFLNVYDPPPPLIHSSSTDGRTDSFSPSILPSSRNLFILGDFNCHHLLWDSRGTSDPHGEEVFDWVISSDLPLNYPDTSTLLHRSSPDISFAISSLALSCSAEVLQDLDSDHLPILLSVPLSPVFCPNECPPFFNFQKARWDTLSPTLIPTVLLQRNTHLFPLLLLFSPLWYWMRPNLRFLSAASNAILKPGGLLSWKVQLMKDARLSRPLTEVMKIARLTSPLLVTPRHSSPRPRLRHGRQPALLFHPNQTQKLYTVFFALSLALLPVVVVVITLPPTRRTASDGYPRVASYDMLG